MQLKESTRYRLANGEIVGPLVPDEDGFWLSDLMESGYFGLWRENGTADMFSVDDHRNDQFRIVEELEE